MYVGGKEGEDCLRREASYLRQGNHLEVPLERLRVRTTEQPRSRKRVRGIGVWGEGIK